MIRPLLALLAAALATPVAAKSWEVKMVAGTNGMGVYSPAFLKIAPGDTVKFVAVAKGHNAEAMPTMIPAGATPFKGMINEEVAFTPTAPGLYAYKCKPHVSMGMVGLIQVGNASNRDAVTTAAEKLPPLSKKVMTGLLAQAK